MSKLTRLEKRFLMCFASRSKWNFESYPYSKAGLSYCSAASSDAIHYVGIPPHGELHAARPDTCAFEEHAV